MIRHVTFGYLIHDELLSSHSDSEIILKIGYLEKLRRTKIVRKIVWATLYMAAW